MTKLPALAIVIATTSRVWSNRSTATKIISGLSGLVLAAALAVPAQAGVANISNTSTSAYAINVYDTDNCSDSRVVLPPGYARRGRAFRVNAYIYVNDLRNDRWGGWRGPYAPNYCHRNPDGITTRRVAVRSNA